jgi:hypothetical protein
MFEFLVLVGNSTWPPVLMINSDWLKFKITSSEKPMELIELLYCMNVY